MNFTLFSNEPADFEVLPLDSEGNEATFNGSTLSFTVSDTSIVDVSFEISEHSTLKVVPKTVGTADIILTSTVGGVQITGTLSLLIVAPPPLATQIGFQFVRDL